MPRRLVLRLGRRRTAWEKTNPQEIAEVEFKNPDGAGLDLQPSVYILNAATDDETRTLTVRVRSEHSASFLSPPKPAGTLEVDLEGALEGDPVVSAGETRFQFANAAHAELRLRDDAAVVQLVQRVLDQLPTRAIRVSLRDILEYVDQRLVANDPEWIAVAGSPETGTWADAVATFRKNRASSG